MAPLRPQLKELQAVNSCNGMQTPDSQNPRKGDEPRKLQSPVIPTQAAWNTVKPGSRGL